MANELSLKFLFSLFLISGVTSTNITITNNCDYNVWPGIASSGVSLPTTTGFILRKGESRAIHMPKPWIGHIWGRSLCTTNSTGTFSCLTGDCLSGKIECSGASSTSPTTIAEFGISRVGGQDFYDISVVDGYNLPMMVVPLIPQNGSLCSSVGCVVNLTKTCPPELKVGAENPVACMSACQKFNSSFFCCRGETECKSTLYSENFKSECPLAYTYPLDDATSTIRCPNSPDYVLTFCPSTTSTTPTTPTAPTAPTAAKRNNGSAVAESPNPAPTKNGTLEPPSPSQRSSEIIHVRPKQKSSWKLKLILEKSSWKLKLILGASSTFTVVIFIVVAVLLRKKARNRDLNSKNVEAVVMLKQYSYTKIKKMTNSFAHVLGKGGFGTVYKGKLPDGGYDVAVKIFKETQGNGEEFINEVASMSRTSHVNIVSLLGFCFEGNKRAIIYEFMSNGSLDKFISANMAMKIEWEKLYDIAVGVARGLEYLHNRCVTRIVHFDIKPQNILIDEDLCPKISDFGLAKLCKNKESIMSTLGARGTAGYIAPEMFSNNFGGVSHKSDVYSYGMVVLEISGARNSEHIEIFGPNNSSMYFPDWIYKDFERGETMKIFGDQITEEEEKIAKKMVLIGLWCIQTHPSNRPTMIKVIEMFESDLETLQVPPKPLLCLPETMVLEPVEDSTETSNFSSTSQFQRNYVSGDLNLFQRNGSRECTSKSS